MTSTSASILWPPLVAASLAFAGCLTGIELDSAESCGQDCPESIADWTLLIYAANDDRSLALVSAFDQDAEEWRTGLGGSEAFKILVQRDYAPSQGLPSERYRLHREVKVDPRTGEAGTWTLGETDTSDSSDLADFLSYGIRTYPAHRYWVIISGHGDGWNGLAYDATTDQETGTSGNRLSLADLSEALGHGAHTIADHVRTELGVSGSDRIDVVQFDACHMGAAEVASQLVDSTDFVVASRDVVPNAGHPYSALRALAQNHPGSSPRTVVREVVTDFVRAYTDHFSTRDPVTYRFVGKPVTGIGLELGNISGLERSLSDLSYAIESERKNGFDCAELRAVRNTAIGAADDISDGRGPDVDSYRDPEDAPGRVVLGSRASVDLIALLEVLADETTSPVAVSADVRAAARTALELIDRPDLAHVPLVPPHRGEYRRLIGFGPASPFVVEAHRVDPDTLLRVGSLSVVWPEPRDLYEMTSGASLGATSLASYLAGTFEDRTHWSRAFAGCTATALACRQWDGVGENPCAPLR